MAKEFLRGKGVAYEEIDVTGNDAARAELLVKAEGRRTVPQIFIGEKPIGGYSDMVALDQAGGLQPLLNG